jgi:hypothetical protein
VAFTPNDLAGIVNTKKADELFEIQADQDGCDHHCSDCCPDLYDDYNYAGPEED